MFSKWMIVHCVSRQGKKNIFCFMFISPGFRKKHQIESGIIEPSCKVHKIPRYLRLLMPALVIQIRRGVVSSPKFPIVVRHIDSTG